MASPKRSGKKSIIPGVLLGTWLVAATVLLVIMFMNMPPMPGDGGSGRVLVKPINDSRPSTDGSGAADPDSMNRVVRRLDRVEDKLGDLKPIQEELKTQSQTLASLDQRVGRLESVVTGSSASAVPDAVPDAVFDPVPDSTPTESPTPSDSSTPTTSTTDLQPATASDAGAREPDTTPSPMAATSTQEAETPSPTPSARTASTAAPPDEDVEEGNRRAVLRKIAAREAYIRRTASIRKAALTDRAQPTARATGPEPTEAFDRRPAPTGGPGPIAAAPTSQRSRPPAGPAIEYPAGSLHSISRRFGQSTVIGNDPTNDLGSTAPGMTIFPELTGRN